MTTSWWIIGNQERTEFVGWSCGVPGPLIDAAVYRTEDNAEKKLKSLHKFSQGEYTGYKVHEINVSLK